MSDMLQFFGGQAFNPNSVEPTKDYEVYPPGKYPVVIEKTKVTQTKARDGHFIYLEMSILEGPFKGRKIFDRLNIDNPNQQTAEWAIQTLGALTKAIGIDAFDNTDQLLGQYCMAHIKVGKDGQNNVRTYSALSAQGGPDATAPPSQQPQVASQYVPLQQPRPVPQVAPQPMQGQAPQTSPAPAQGSPPWAGNS